MESFSEWLNRQNEDMFGAVGDFFHKISTAAKMAAWAVRHPTEIPPQIGHAIAEEWHNLVGKYGTAEATIIFASLVVSLGPGIVVPGSMALFFVTLGVCKAFNSITKKGISHETPKISDGQVRQEVARLKDVLMKKAEVGH